MRIVEYVENEKITLYASIKTEKGNLTEAEQREVLTEIAEMYQQLGAKIKKAIRDGKSSREIYHIVGDIDQIAAIVAPRLGVTTILDGPKCPVEYMPHINPDDGELGNIIAARLDKSNLQK